MSKDEEIDDHPSYGMVGWNRIQVGGGMTLFGSPMRNTEVIAIRICHADKRRDLSRDWYHAGKQVTEVYISPAQFADFLTAPNRGDGVPCTIRSTELMPQIETPSFEPQVEVFNKELKEDMSNIRNMAQQLKDVVEPVLRNGKAKKADRDEAANVVYKLAQDILSNLEYTHKSLGKAMEKTVSAAKSEVEAFIQHRIHDAGLEHLGSDITPKLLDGEDK